MDLIKRDFFFNVLFNLKLELLAVFRCYNEILYLLLFLLLAIALFPLSVSPDPELLRKIGPGIIWVVILFLVLIMLEQLFRSDWQEGELEQLILVPSALTLALYIKLFIFWFALIIPLLILVPFLSLSLYIPFMALKTLCLSLFLGTSTLVFLGGVVRVLTLGLRHSGLLIILIIIPFYIPVLIFGSSAVRLSSVALSPNGPLAWLGVLMLLSVSIAPFAMSSILRLGVIFA